MRIAWNKGKGKYGESGWRITQQCNSCGEDFETTKYKVDLGEGKYCSKACASRVVKNAWKGNGVGYRGLHHWVERLMGVPKICDICGIENRPAKDGRRTIQWSNRSGEYRRDLTDWQALCYKCHGQYDKELRQRKESF